MVSTLCPGNTYNVQARPSTRPQRSSHFGRYRMPLPAACLIVTHATAVKRACNVFLSCTYLAVPDTRSLAVAPEAH